MPNFGITASNLAWMASCLPAYRSFLGALRNPQAAQESVLKQIVAHNSGAEFGRVHGFSAITKISEYQTQIPISSYDNLAPFINRIRTGEENVLTTEPVRLFERTSGSSSAAKYIPYTDSLRREFQQAVRAWIFDLYRHDARLLQGRSYWLITPLSREKEITSGGIPVGFESDADYLGTLERKIAEALFAVPGELAQVPDIEASLYLSLRFLLQVDDLTLISVWNPSYLSILMNRFDSWTERLIEDLRQGTATPPTRMDMPFSLTQKLRAQPKRARELQQILKSEGRLCSQDLWPRLRLISCWTGGAARQTLHELSRCFPRVRIQGKGLLATEGIATIPWTDAKGCLPALTSHFYEFLPENGDKAKLVHELDKDAEYSLLMTTGGGLYRYRLGDRVRVQDFYGCVPVLEFIGRDDGVSDLRGEKLSPAFVQTCLDQVLVDAKVDARFAMLAPQHQAVPGYVLYVESSANPEQLQPGLESKLRANPHYVYCRNLGQLGPVKVCWIRQGAQDVYVNRCAELGQRAGSVKPTSLHRSGGWEDFFAGEFVANYQPEVARAGR
jgi:hypothetical protein